MSTAKSFSTESSERYARALFEVAKESSELEKIEGIDPGAPINPNIGKKFLITTILTSIIFLIIYYLVKFNFLNLREYLQ